MKEHKPRNLIEIADKIIDVIKNHSNLTVERADEITNQIEKVKKVIDILHLKLHICVGKNYQRY